MMLVALALTMLGACFAVAGVTLIYPPAGLIAAGAALVGVGLLVLDVEAKP